ncbi:hypothetical protein NQZ68_036318 [Dissostichus eleginoides]|nr:hypothetical protein NQZ68_036318 [Dissostichus eleginoides]
MVQQSNKNRIYAKPWTAHPVKPHQHLYFMPDVPHVVKNLKSALVNGHVITIPQDVVDKEKLPSSVVSVPEGSEGHCQTPYSLPSMYLASPFPVHRQQPPASSSFSSHHLQPLPAPSAAAPSSSSSTLLQQQHPPSAAAPSFSSSNSHG